MKPDIIDKLFRQYYNDALLYTMSLSHNKTVAEDIVSSAFYIALQSSDDSIQNFKAWLLTVCRNEYFDYLRKNSRISDDEISEEVEDECEQLVDGIIRKEEYRALYRAVDMLPDTQREAILLFYFYDMPVKEISAVIGKSESNTKVILHRSRESLKKIMEDIL